MYLRLLTPLLLTLLSTCVRAQNVLTGSVIDAKTQTTLPYVYLKVNGVALGTVTEADGSYRLEVPTRYADRSVTFSYLGYQDLALTVRELSGRQEPVRLKPAAAQLAEVTVTPKKLPPAKAILRRALGKLHKNYPQDFTHHEGYYRETLTENGAYIKFSDAAVTYRSAAYTGKKNKWKHLENTSGWGTTLGNFASWAGDRLHRVHFDHRTLKTEQAHIASARASENGTTRHMDASINGGPLSLMGRDRLKYPSSFLGRKRNKDFTYLVDEVKMNDRWVYALHFKTTTTKAILDAAPENTGKWKKRQWNIANRHKLLEGTIFVDPDSYAILRYTCRVPNELKPYFCGYKTMAIKHFDYKLDVRYQEVDGRYVVDYARHEDEFIFKDTTDQKTTPYVATSEWTRLNTDFAPGGPFPAADNFANVDRNELYEFPLEYDSLYWVDYERQHPEALIGATIREDMESEKRLETQFGDRIRRDPDMPAPVAAVDPVVTEIHGMTLTDDYAWLKDPKTARSNRPVMEYLRAENDFTDNHFKPLRRLQRGIFTSLKRSVRKDFVSLPTRDNGYIYTYAYSGDKEYPVYLRAPIAEPTKTDTLIDVNKEAEKHDYYQLGGLRFAPDNNTMAFAENTTGSDRYVLRFKTIDDGKLLPDSLTDLGNIVWIDNNTLLYARQNPRTLRTYRVMRHRLGTSQADDEIVYHEPDPLFGVSISRTKSKTFILISSGSTDATETWMLRTDNPYEKPRLIVSREEGLNYGVTHDKDKLYITANPGKAINYAVFETDTGRVERKHWKELIPHRKDALLQGLTVFDNYFVVSEKIDAQSRLRIIDRRTNESKDLKLREDFYSISTGYNPETNTDTLQFSYSSPVTSTRVVNYHMGTGEKRIVRRARNTNTTGKMKVRREYATAPDGTEIPLTIIYAPWRDGGRNPDNSRVYLTSYGSYGSGSEVGYSPVVSTIVGRGFTYVIAHVRGGDDLGTQWYEDGKMLRKKNTFTDFIAAADHLIARGYAQPGTITAQGGSAGGLLMGAVANMRPDLWRAVILDVPFVDVINTMLDDKLPLTTGEYLEWGNPNVKKYFKYMLEYSPYENVVAQDYPHMFFFTGLNDTRVGYWEPAKMVAKLRRLKTNDKLLLLKTDLTAGHGGGSGRYAGLQEAAYKLALIFDLYAEEEGVK